LSILNQIILCKVNISQSLLSLEAGWKIDLNIVNDNDPQKNHKEIWKITEKGFQVLEEI